MKSARNVQNITQFFDVVDRVTVAVSGDESLREEININVGQSKDADVASLLKKLFDNALNNSQNPKGGNRHDLVVKQFAATLLILMGKSSYEFLQSNLGMVFACFIM